MKHKALIKASAVFVLTAIITEAFSVVVTTGLQFQSASIRLQRVSYQYPKNLFNFLTSSDPYREYALKDISLDLANDVYVLCGKSRSGKSTVLDIIRRKIVPIEGTVAMAGTGKAIYLDGVPKERYNQKESVQDVLLRMSTSQSSARDLVQYVCDDVLDLDRSAKPFALSQSDVFKFGLAQACVQSCELVAHGDSYSWFSSPLLLTDEWLDLETTTVIRKVEVAMKRLCDKCGACIVMVTHKPERLSASSQDGIIRLSGGRLMRYSKLLAEHRLS